VSQSRFDPLTSFKPSLMVCTPTQGVRDMKKKKKQLTLAQKLAFRSPIARPGSAKAPPYSDRMGVRVNVA